MAHDNQLIIPVQDFDAVIFDMDGVVTDTASVHAMAWKKLFDGFLEDRAEHTNEPYEPFNIDTDYRLHVDGIPRLDGVRRFLKSRAITLCEGSSEDLPGVNTVHALGNLKNDYFRDALAEDGARLFETTAEFIRTVRERGLTTAIISSSRNCKNIIESVGVSDLFNIMVDGNEMARRRLKGKPASDIFREAAFNLGVQPNRAIVVEDAVLGVQAGRNGNFGLVIGIDRTGHPDDLKMGGADIVVQDLSELTLVQVKEKTRSASTWALTFQGFDPGREGVREALCTLGNGYFATRGAAPEADADDIHYPGTYIAGCYNRLTTEIAGRKIENEDLVNVPNWLPIKIRPEGGEWFNVMAMELLSYRQDLDLKTGTLVRSIRYKDRDGRITRLSSRRFVSMADPHLAVQDITVIPENWSGRLEVRSALDAGVVNSGVERYRELRSKHLTPLESGPLNSDAMYVVAETNHSHVRIAQAARTRIYRNGKREKVKRETCVKPDYVSQDMAFDVEAGRPVTVQKVIALFTSRDPAISDPGREAQEVLKRSVNVFHLYEAHTRAWDRLWNVCGITIKDGASTERALRLHIFHLMQTMSFNTIDLDVGVPARGIHGEGYRGHIFWDEVFICPFFSVSVPQITRSILMYRYRRLPMARLAARAAGYEGAMYPWQSGANGHEESQQLHLNPRSGRWIPDNSSLQRHVNAAIVYNVWKYYQATDDLQFLSNYGAEMVLEIAGFLASLATYDKEQERFEILGVMGPDEYSDGYPDVETPGINNNAYTNVMTVWVLCRALEVLELLSEERQRELCAQLGLGKDEIELWDRISRKMKVVFHDDGIISQYEGYGDLKEFDWRAYRKKYGDIRRLDRLLEAEGDSPNCYKASKQADVLMLFYLFSEEEVTELFERLGYPFPHGTVRKNVTYYTQRTSHGSSLSQVVNSSVLARLDRESSWKLFRQALESDIGDEPGGTTAEGIHLGAMAGTVDLVQRGYGGVELRADALYLDPCLPSNLKRVRFPVIYRGHRVDIDISGDKVTVRTSKSSAKPIKIVFCGKEHRFAAGNSKTFRFPDTKEVSLASPGGSSDK